MRKKLKLQEYKECYICGRTEPLELHHIFMGQKHRKLADEDGLTVWLCPLHHRLSNNSVHMNPEMRLELQQMGQRAYLKHHKMSEWMERYGKNYLDDERSEE